MGFLGFFTRNEAVRCWANFVTQGGVPVVPTTPTISIYQGGVAIVSGAAMTQHTPGSNLFYYDYTVPTSPTEGTLEVVYRGLIEGEVAEASDHFKIDLVKSRVLETRLGNTRLTFYPATTSNPTRKTQIGVLDYQVLEIKRDEDADWTSPVSTKTLYFWYFSIGDQNPYRVGESD